MVFNAVFHIISVKSSRPVHLSMLSCSSFYQYSAQYSSKVTGCFFRIAIVETINSDEKGMNPVAMTIVNPWQEYWPSRGSNQRSPVLKPLTLQTDLHVHWLGIYMRQTKQWWQRIHPIAQLVQHST